jgi:hypothetical protein
MKLVAKPLPAKACVLVRVGRCVLENTQRQRGKRGRERLEPRSRPCSSVADELESGGFKRPAGRPGRNKKVYTIDVSWMLPIWEWHIAL